MSWHSGTQTDSVYDQLHSNKQFMLHSLGKYINCDSVIEMDDVDDYWLP